MDKNAAAGPRLFFSFSPRPTTTTTPFLPNLLLVPHLPYSLLPLFIQYFTPFSVTVSKKKTMHENLWGASGNGATTNQTIKILQKKNSTGKTKKKNFDDQNRRTEEKKVLLLNKRRRGRFFFFLFYPFICNRKRRQGEAWEGGWKETAFFPP